MVSHSNGDFRRPNYAAVIEIIIFQRRLNRWKTGHNEDHMHIQNMHWLLDPFMYLKHLWPCRSSVLSCFIIISIIFVYFFIWLALYFKEPAIKAA